MHQVAQPARRRKRGEEEGKTSQSGRMVLTAAGLDKKSDVNQEEESCRKAGRAISAITPWTLQDGETAWQYRVQRRGSNLAVLIGFQIREPRKRPGAKKLHLKPLLVFWAMALPSGRGCAKDRPARTQTNAGAYVGLGRKLYARQTCRSFDSFKYSARLPLMLLPRAKLVWGGYRGWACPEGAKAVPVWY